MEHKNGCEYIALEGFKDKQEYVSIFYLLPLSFTINHLLVFLGNEFTERYCGVSWSDFFEAFGADSLGLIRQFIDFILDVDEVLE